MLTKGQQFMFLIWHLPCYSCIQSSPVKVLAVIEDPPCYSCIQSSPVKVLAVITDRKHLHKMWKIHCHLRYGYFLAVNHIVMTTVEFVSDHFNLGVIEVPPCYSCIQSSPVKVLAVIEVPPCYSCIKSSSVKVLAVIEDPSCNSCIQSSPVKVLTVIKVPPCNSCIQSSPVKVLAVIEDPSCYSCIQGSRLAQWVRSLDLTAHTSLSPIRVGSRPAL